MRHNVVKYRYKNFLGGYTMKPYPNIQPNLTTKSEQINIRMTAYTVEQIDKYAAELNMKRSNMIEVMLMFFIKYAAVTKQERRSKL
jgi:hypothetical protein